jgi:hypothetical protein
MILESILEKSGLVKGREYFLEHELRDEDNKALFSEFSGKKCVLMPLLNTLMKEMSSLIPKFLYSFYRTGG